MLCEVFKNLTLKDLLVASQVSKFWRAVAVPIIALSVVIPISWQSLDKAIRRFDQFTIGYKHMIVYVSFFLKFIQVNLLVYNFSEFCL